MPCEKCANAKANMWKSSLRITFLLFFVSLPTIILALNSVMQGLWWFWVGVSALLLFITSGRVGDELFRLRCSLREIKNCLCSEVLKVRSAEITPDIASKSIDLKSPPIYDQVIESDIGVCQSCDKKISSLHKAHHCDCGLKYHLTCFYWIGKCRHSNDSVRYNINLNSKIICQVCGEGIISGNTAMNCATCQTPHHKDCWEYNGGCSIYACQCKTPITNVPIPRSTPLRTS